MARAGTRSRSIVSAADRKRGPEAARIYRYVVRYDCGSAPRPFGGWCSLAICKPQIRKAARVGDWIIGFRSRRPGEVIYAMRVDERLELAQYWSDKRFKSRRPGFSPLPDNIYRRTRSGELVQVPNRVHGASEVTKDISGGSALLSRRFWYFGANSVPLPNELLHLVHTTHSHAVHTGRRVDDVQRLREWLAAWPRGVHGHPVDSSMLLADAEAKSLPNQERRFGRMRRACATA